MNKLIALIFAICLAGCTTPSGSPTPPTARRATNCSQYIGGYSACASSCSSARQHSAMSGPPCPSECKQFPIPNTANCSALCSFEHTREIEREGEYSSCMLRCNNMPFECR